MDIWTHWYFTIPNYILAAVMYSLLGRWILSLFVPPHWDNYIWRAFCRLSDPALYVVRFFTPKIVPLMFLIPLTIVWIMLTRIFMRIGFKSIGLLG
jgi:uncharacterized protein YggT (Ycf19 family)